MVPLKQFAKRDVSDNLFDTAFFDPFAGVTLELLDSANLRPGTDDLLFLDYDLTISKTAGFLSSKADAEEHVADAKLKYNLTDVNFKNIFYMYLGGVKRFRMLNRFLRNFGLRNVYVVTANGSPEVVEMMMTLIVGKPFTQVRQAVGAEAKRFVIEDMLDARDARSARVVSTVALEGGARDKSERVCSAGRRSCKSLGFLWFAL